MKNVDEMTHEEIVELDDETIQVMLDYICAEQGIKFLPAPICPEQVTQLVETDIYYEWNGIRSRDKETVDQFRKLFESARSKLIDEEYYSDVGYDYKYVTNFNPDDYSNRNLNEVHENKLYSRDELDAHRLILAKYKKDKEIYDRDYKTYADNKKERHEVTTWTIQKINIHKMMEKDLKRDIEIIDNKYLPIAQDNIEIALAFFEKAFEINEWIKYRIKKHYNIQDALNEGNKQFIPDIHEIVNKLVEME